MANNQRSDIRIKIETIISYLLKNKKSKNNTTSEYNEYNEVLLLLFNNLLEKNEVLLKISENSDGVYYLDEILNRLSFAHLPKTSLIGFLSSISILDLPHSITLSIDSCLDKMNKYYPRYKKNIKKSFKDLLKETNITNGETLQERFSISAHPMRINNHKLLDEINNNLENEVKELNNKVEKLLKDDGTVRKQIYGQATKRSSEILAKLQQEISDLQASTKQSIIEQIEQIKTDLANSKSELMGLVGDLEAYKSIVNNETEKEISKHYAEKARSEMRTYWVATILSIVIIVVSICLAWSGLNSYFETYVQETNPVKLKALAQTARYAEIYLGFRLVLSFLLFSTVIYTSRIAYRAYIHWRHSESMKLKLSSLRPFINQLEPDDRKQIHKDLVPDYFGKDAGMIDVAGEKFKDFPTNVSAVVMKAMDHANSALGNSKKEENTKEDKNADDKEKK